MKILHFYALNCQFSLLTLIPSCSESILCWNKCAAVCTQADIRFGLWTTNWSYVLTFSSGLDPIFNVFTATATQVSSISASPPYTVPNAPSPSLRFSTTCSRDTSHWSRLSQDVSARRPNSCIRSRVTFTFASYLQANRVIHCSSLTE